MIFTSRNQGKGSKLRSDLQMSVNPSEFTYSLCIHEIFITFPSTKNVFTDDEDEVVVVEGSSDKMNSGRAHNKGYNLDPDDTDYIHSVTDWGSISSIQRLVLMVRMMRATLRSMRLPSAKGVWS